MSDNLLEDNDKPKVDEVANIKDILDKKEKVRKGHNVSVTTSTSTNSTNANRKTTYG